MALTAEQENKVVAMLSAFENGKRINELEAAQGAVGQMLIEVMDETGETRKAELGAAVENASIPLQGVIGMKTTPPLRRRVIMAVCRPYETCREN